MEVNLAKLSRQDIEDKLYQLHEENVGLKKQGHTQNEKMKRLATKILRLKSDMKRIQAGKPTKYTNENEVVDELKMKIAGLEQEVTSLQQKLKLLKNAPTPDNKSKLNRTGYGFVEPRVDTGLPYKPGGVVTPSPGRQKTPGSKLQGKPPPSYPQYGQSMLNNARQEIEQLDEIVDQLKFQIQVLEEDKQDLINKQQDIELTYENKLLALREQLLEQHRTGISEDIDLINIQRQLKEKDDKLFDSDAKLLKVRNELSQAKTERDRSENDVFELKTELEKLHSKLRTTRHQADDSFIQSNQAHELSIALEEVQTERDMLKLENSRLMEDVFDVEKEKVYKQNERKLRDRVKQLEHRLERFQSTPQKLTDEHDEVFDKYITERDRAAELEHLVNKLEIRNRELQSALDRTQQMFEEEQKERIRERDTRLQDASEAISATVPINSQISDAVKLPVLNYSESEVGSQEQLKMELCELQTEYANLVLELDKYKMLLETEYKLKKVYQEEVGAITTKYEAARREHAKKEDETAKLLDIRTHKINKLELQLRDIAYGTKQVKIEPTSDSENPSDYNISLERGQNVLEIHIGKLYTAHESLVTPDEKLFIVLNFYHFETVITKVMSQSQPDFNTTSQYIVNVDDFFLKTIQHDTTSLYLYTCSGVQFRCVAVCQLHLKELLNQTGGTRLHGSLQLIGTLGDMNGMVFANIEYHIRLKFPMTHSLLLYKERLKANTYLSSNIKQSSTTGGTSATAEENYNELKITIVRCTKLIDNTSIQPSSYVMYKFYTFADHDTPIIESSNDPQFNDVKVYPVTTDGQLHRYLSQGQCRVYVFNDKDKDYLIGTAEISLISLAHGNNITGLFEVKDKSGRNVGVVEVKMQWMISYEAPYATPDVITPAARDTSRARVPCDIDTATQQILPEHYDKVLSVAPTLEEEIVTQNLQPRPSQVTFDIEEVDKSSVTENMVHHVKEEEQQRTEFLSFRSLEEYEKATKKEDEDKSSEMSDKEITEELDNEIEVIDDVTNNDVITSDDVTEDVDVTPSQKVQKVETTDEKDTTSTDKSYAEVVKQPQTIKQPGLVASSTPGISKLKKKIDENQHAFSPDIPSKDLNLVSPPTNEFDDSSSEDDDVVLGTFEAKPTTPVPTPEPPQYRAESDLQPLNLDGDDSDSNTNVTPVTPMTPASNLNNTFFEEDPDSESDDVAIPLPAQAEEDDAESLEEITEALISSDEEDDLVMISRDIPHGDTLDSQLLDTVSTEPPDTTPRAPPLVVIVHFISFEKDAHFIGNGTVDQVFVEYNLMGVEDGDTETPQSLHIKPDIKLYFNFRKTFFVDKNSTEWHRLNKMVTNQIDSGIKFTIWSDPGDTTDADCTPLCSATVQIPTGLDIIENEVPLISQKLGTNVGVICLTVETKSALQTLGILDKNS